MKTFLPYPVSVDEYGVVPVTTCRIGVSEEEWIDLMERRRIELNDQKIEELADKISDKLVESVERQLA